MAKKTKNPRKTYDEQFKREHPCDPSAWISHEAIYQWVYREAENGKPHHERLRRGRKRRRRRIPGERKGKRGQIVDRVGIEKRPVAANDRRRFGDWESDTVEGAKGNFRGWGWW